jgi:hypothetical protein
MPSLAACVLSPPAARVLAPSAARVLSPPAARVLLPHLRCAIVAAPPPPPVVVPTPLPVSYGRIRSIGCGSAPFLANLTSTSAQMAPMAVASTRAHGHHVPAPVTSRVSGPSPWHQRFGFEERGNAYLGRASRPTQNRSLVCVVCWTAFTTDKAT